jgi:hypothetical protein
MMKRRNPRPDICSCEITRYTKRIFANDQTKCGIKQPEAVGEHHTG